MKNGKLHKASGTFKVLLGLAVVGVLLFAGCQNIFDPPVSQETGEGRVIITTELGTERTIMPYLDPTIIVPATGYTYKFYKGEGVNAANEITPKIDAQNFIVLPFGTYTVNAIGKNGGGITLVEGTSVFIVQAEINNVTVYVGPAKTGTGTFKFSITVPSSSYQVAVTLNKWEVGSGGTGNYNTIVKQGKTGAPGDVGIATSTVYTAGASNAGWVLPSGSYLFSVRIYGNNADNKPGYWGFSEAVHIYDSLITAYPDTTTPATTKTVTAADIAEIVDARDARRVLKDSLASWMDEDVLVHSPDKFFKEDDTKVYLYYLADKFSNPATMIFPITVLAGSGWALEPAGTWTLTSKSAEQEFVLRHADTVTTSGGNTVQNDVKVYVHPVVRYNVSFHSLATGSRSIRFNPTQTQATLSLPDLNTNLTNALFQNGRTGVYYGEVAPGEILVTNLDIVVDSTLFKDRPGPNSTPAGNGATPFTYPLLGVTSRDYFIVVHVPVQDQFENALTTARTGLIPKVQAVATAHGTTVYNRPVQTTPPDTPLTQAELDSIRLDYIAGKVPAGTTDFPLSAELIEPFRWELVPTAGNTWAMATISTKIQPLKLRLVYSTGDRSDELDNKVFTINLTPVAKFIFANSLSADTTRIVNIKDAAYTTSTTLPDGPALAIGPNIVNLIGSSGTAVNTVIKATNSLVTFEKLTTNAAGATVTGGPVYANIRTGASTTADPDSTYTFTGEANATPEFLTSNEYNVVVYKKQSEQMEAAKEFIREKDHSSWVKPATGFTGTGKSGDQLRLARPSYQKFNSVGGAAGLISTENILKDPAPSDNVATTTKLYYLSNAGATTPATTAIDLALPTTTDYDGYSLEAIGADSFTDKTRKVQLRPFGFSVSETTAGDHTGGLQPVLQDVYTIITHEVMQYVINFYDDKGKALDAEKSGVTNNKESDGSLTPESATDSSPQKRQITIQDSPGAAVTFYPGLDDNLIGTFKRDASSWYAIADLNNLSVTVTANGLITVKTSDILTSNRTASTAGTPLTAAYTKLAAGASGSPGTPAGSSTGTLTISSTPGSSRVYEITVQPSQEQQLATALRFLKASNPVGVFITDTAAAKNPSFKRIDTPAGSEKFDVYYVADTAPAVPTTVFNTNLLPYGVAANWRFGTAGDAGKIQFQGDGAAAAVWSNTYAIAPKKVAQFEVASFNVPRVLSTNVLTITNGASPNVQTELLRNEANQQSRHVDTLNADGLISADTAFTVTAPAGDSLSALTATGSIYNTTTKKYEFPLDGTTASANLGSRLYTINLYPTYEVQNEIGNAQIRLFNDDSWSWISEPVWAATNATTQAGKRPDKSIAIIKDSFKFPETDAQIIAGTGAKKSYLYVINGASVTDYGVTIPPAAETSYPAWALNTSNVFNFGSPLPSPLVDTDVNLTLGYKGIASGVTAHTYTVTMVPVAQIEVNYAGANTKVRITDTRGLNGINGNSPDFSNADGPVPGAPVDFELNGARKAMLVPVAISGGNANQITVTFPEGGNTAGNFEVRMNVLANSNNAPTVVLPASGNIADGLVYTLSSNRYRLDIINLNTPTAP